MTILLTLYFTLWGISLPEYLRRSIASLSQWSSSSVYRTILARGPSATGVFTVEYVDVNGAGTVGSPVKLVYLVLLRLHRALQQLLHRAATIITAVMRMQQKDESIRLLAAESATATVSPRRSSPWHRLRHTVVLSRHSTYRCSVTCHPPATAQPAWPAPLITHR